MTDFAAARRTMVENQIRTYDVHDPVLLSAFENVPRETFVDPAHSDFAYLDRDVAARDGTTMLLKPMVLARLIQALELNAGERVLDVGGGGYGAAVLKSMGLSPIALASDAASVRASLATAGFDDIPVVAGSLAAGLESQGPFDAILVHGSSQVEPTALLNQLKDDGTLAIVIGQGRSARATVFRRIGSNFSGARAFDASAPLLADFAAKPEFAF